MPGWNHGGLNVRTNGGSWSRARGHGAELSGDLRSRGRIGQRYPLYVDEPRVLVDSSLLVSGCAAGLGLILLLVGGEVLLRGAVALAHRFGLSPLLIGLTVVAAATSMPELVVVVASGVQGHPNLGVGNVIGSNIANTLLILGVAAVLFPISTQLSHVTRDGAIGLAAALLFAVFALMGTVTWTHGTIMLLLLVGYLVHSYRAERVKCGASAGTAGESGGLAAAEGPAVEEPQTAKSIPLIIMLVLAGSPAW